MVGIVSDVEEHGDYFVEAQGGCGIWGQGSVQLMLVIVGNSRDVSEASLGMGAPCR
jgi:hypothetical protein